jgi:hypothetical protein
LKLFSLITLAHLLVTISAADHTRLHLSSLL